MAYEVQSWACRPKAGVMGKIYLQPHSSWVNQTKSDVDTIYYLIYNFYQIDFPEDPASQTWGQKDDNSVQNDSCVVFVIKYWLGF